jgi:hypothetical protein
VSEVETIDPEEIGNSGVEPLLEEIKSFFQVTNKATQWLETGIALRQPQRGHLAVNNLVQCHFKLWAQQYLTLNCFLHLVHGVANSRDE